MRMISGRLLAIAALILSCTAPAAATCTRTYPGSCAKQDDGVDKEVPVLGENGGTAGGVKLMGAGTGYVLVQPPTGTITSYNFNLPATTGAAGSLLTSAGGGSSAMTWTTPDTSNITFAPSGTGATARTAQAKLRDTVSILDFGGDNTGTNDNSAACQNALASFPLNQGGTLLFPAGSYKFTSNCNIPAFHSPAVVTFEMGGAILNATGAITVFNRHPATQTIAENIAGAAFRFHGGSLVGDGTTGGTGIFLGASYNSVIEDTYLNYFDVGIDLAFSLNAQLRGVHTLWNLTNDVRIQSGLGQWTGGSVANSQSNAVTISNFRAYSGTGMQANISILGCDGASILDSIFEGNNPVYNVYYDDLSSTNTKSGVTIRGIHQENSPTGSIVYLQGVGGANFTIDKLYTQGAQTLLDVTNIGVSTYHISNIVYVATFNPAFKLSAGEIYGHFWHFDNWGDGSSDITNPAFWQSGRVPISLIGIQREPAGNGGMVMGNSIYIGTSNNVASMQEGAFIAGNLMFSPDNTFHFGKGGSANYRPLDAFIGTGGLTSAGIITGSGGFGLTSMFASQTAPTIASGFCTSPTIAASNGTATFEIHIGTGCAASSGVLTMPAANGWACHFHNVTHPDSNTVEMSAK